MALLRQFVSGGLMALFAIDASIAQTKGVETAEKAQYTASIEDKVGACPDNLAPTDKAGFLQFAACQAAKENLPGEIAHAVMEIESNFNPGAFGGVGEVGLMQVLPSTARLMGFRGTNEELAKPETNIRYGVRYLSEAWQLGNRDLCTAVMKYRAGHAETRFSYLSVQYCRRARNILQRDGFKVAGELPVATFGFNTGGFSSKSAGGGACLRRSFVPGPGYGRCLAGSGKISQSKAVALRRSIFGG